METDYNIHLAGKRRYANTLDKGGLQTEFNAILFEEFLSNWVYCMIGTMIDWHSANWDWR